MPPRNPSELARLEEERNDILQRLHSARPFPLAKDIKESLLHELRTIERTLGIEPRPYNSEDFFRL